MTEQQREDELLSQLLTAAPAGVRAAQQMSQSDERALLHAANRAGTPSLAPEAADEPAAASFAGELVNVVRRYPLPAVAVGAALVFLLARRR